MPARPFNENLDIGSFASPSFLNEVNESLDFILAITNKLLIRNQIQKMQKRKLGNSNLEFTTVGVGTWAIGGGDWAFGWGAQDAQQAINGILHGIELGINWIDTAAVYGAGASEELVGKALSQMDSASRPFVATKCGRINREDGTVFARITRESVIAECEASLKRLNVESIDLYQMHWPDPDEMIEECWSTMVELKQQGKVREIGVSNHNASQMKRLQAIHPVASLQPPYNMLNRGIEDEILPFCGDENIGVICYSPMGKGLLTGGFTKERAESLEVSDHRSRDPKFASPQLEINLDFVDAIKPIAKANDRPLAQLSIAWTLSRPEMTSAIVGVRKPEQIEQTAAAADWVLTEDELKSIELALKDRDEKLAVAGATDQGRV